MKTVETLKEREFESRLEALLRGLLGRVPFLKLVSLKKDAKISPQLQDHADCLAQVTAGDRKWTLVVEEKRLGQPREVRTAVLQLGRQDRSRRRFAAPPRRTVPAAPRCARSLPSGT